MAAPSIQIRVNIRKMDRQIRAVESGHDAIVHTLQNAGVGQVITTKRSPKPRWAKGKWFHGTAIANFMRGRGVEPITYDDSVLADAESTMNTAVAEAIDDSFRTAQSQAHVLKDIVRLLAMELADNARERGFAGKVGKNTERTRIRKRRLAAAGYATTEGGSTPPYGVETGAFFNGLKGQWNRGKKGRRRGVG
jgi:hypothetical protein